MQAAGLSAQVERVPASQCRLCSSSAFCRVPPAALRSAALLHDLRGHSADVLCHQQGGAQLATGAADCSARLWDLRSGRERHAVPLGSFPYCLQARAAAGAAAGLAHGDARPELWPRPARRRTRLLLPPVLPGGLTAARAPRLCRPQMDDRRLAVGCSNGSVQVVDLRGGTGAQEGAQLQAHAVLPMHRERVR